MSPPRIFVLAGESSGDRLGAAMIQRLRALSPGVEIRGVGAEAMAAEGVESLFPMRDIAVMGFTEVVPHLPRILRRLSEAADAVEDWRPDALVTVDAQVFSALLATKAMASSPRTARVQYVAPSVWAWKPWRARKAAALFDRMLALLPMEPPYFTEHGLPCDLVGHPVIERSATITDVDGAALRVELGAAPDAPLLLVAPGSRMSEIARLTEPFGGAAARLAALHPGLEVVVPLAAPVADETLAALSGWPVPVHALDPRGLSFEAAERRKFAAFKAADAALAASGTVSLELAAMRCPHVIGYRASKLTEFLIRRLADVHTGTLVNLINADNAVPEFWQERCAPAPLAGALAPLLSGGAARDAQLAAFDAAFERMGAEKAPPSERAAQAVLQAIADKRQRLSTGT